MYGMFGYRMYVFVYEMCVYEAPQKPARFPRKLNTHKLIKAKKKELFDVCERDSVYELFVYGICMHEVWVYEICMHEMCVCVCVSVDTRQVPTETSLQADKMKCVCVCACACVRVYVCMHACMKLHFILIK